MHAAVVIFPGSNADAEMIHALRDVMQLRTSTVWHRETQLPAATDLVVLPGGFSYGDYLRCGAIAATSPIVSAIRHHADKGGFVLGICNGFQILTETHLLPGALTQNRHLRFECRDIFVTPRALGPFTTGLPAVLRLPIAHANGCYQAGNDLIDRLVREQVIAFQYCDSEGRVDTRDGLAENPNGAVLSIAGIYGGSKRNVLGMMPHPERACESFHASNHGRVIFEAVVRSLAQQADPATRVLQSEP